MPGPRTNAAFYAAPVEEFLAASEEEVYAPLASPHGYTLAAMKFWGAVQQSAWRLQLPVLRAALEELVGQKGAKHIFTSGATTSLDPAKMVAGTLFAGPSLHLATSMRSFRAESLSRFVKALLDGAPSSDRHSGEHRPRALVSEPRERHPLVALSPPYLSQFSRGPKKAETSRTDVKKPERRQYLKNASLVLLTRARQGMVIFVPPGAKRDKTRSPGVAEHVSLSAKHQATAAANAV